MNLRQIEVFRAVMQAGSVTGAARQLHVSQPGVSRMLGHIELQLGLQLFERSRSRLRPTPEAQALYAEVEQVYRGVQRIDERARELKDGAGLSLRVLASPSAALEVVPRALTRLGERYPGARIYLETQLVREMAGQLLRGEADIAIATRPVDHALLHAERVGSWSMACVFTAGHAFEARRSVSLREVMGQPLVAFAPDTPQGRLLTDWAGKHQRRVSSRFEVRAGDTACALVVAGAGVCVVDDLTARAWQGPELAHRPLAHSPVYEVQAVHHSLHPPSALALALVEAVKAGFRGLRRPA